MQPITLALNRSDYMIGSEGDVPDVKRSNKETDVTSSAYALPSAVDESNIHLRQIEFNTMAASFAGLSQNLTSYHR